MIGSNYKIIKNRNGVGLVIQHEDGLITEKFCFSQNLKEAMKRDVEILDVYKNITELTEDDMNHTGSIILGLLTAYTTHFTVKANESNHLETMEEVRETMKYFYDILPIISKRIIREQLKEVSRWIICKKLELNRNNGLRE